MTQAAPRRSDGRTTVREIVEIHHSILNDYKIQTMPAKDFKRKFEAAAFFGEVNEFTPFMRDAHMRPPANEWRMLRETVFERDDYTCRYCGERGGRLECDHVQPVARGGSHLLSNLVTACFSCNRSKRDKTLAEWLA